MDDILRYFEEEKYGIPAEKATGIVTRIDDVNAMIERGELNVLPNKNIVKEMKLRRENQKRENYKIGGLKRSATFAEKRGDTVLSEQLRNQVKLKEMDKIPLSYFDNEINKYSGKDYYININDNSMHGTGYRVSATYLENLNNPALFMLNKYKNEVKRKIKDLEDRYDDIDNAEGKLKGLEFLLEKIDTNVKVMKSDTDWDQFRKDFYQSTGKKWETPQPIFIDFDADGIDIGV